MTTIRASILVVSLALGALAVTGCARQTRAIFQTADQVRLMKQDLAEGRQFPQAVARARAQDLPTRMADLQRPLPPPDQNAALIYTRLMQLLKAHPFSPEEKVVDNLRSDTLPSPAEWDQIARTLHKRADVLHLIHQAAARPRCVFPRDWTRPNPAEITFPELATVRESARLLTAESLLLAHQGRPMEAVKNEALGFQIARHGASDNTLIAYLVGAAVDAVTLSGLKKIMYVAGPNAAVDAAVRASIERDWRPRSLVPALRREVASEMGMIAFLRRNGPGALGRIGDGENSPAGPAQRFDARAWNALLDYNGVFMLRQMRKGIPVIDRPFPEARPVLDAVDTESQDSRHTARFVAVMMLPSLASAAAKRAQIQAMVNVDRVGAAALGQYARTGRLPDVLPGTFADPFTNGPLKYRREGPGGFVVYSVGREGTFDGGKPGMPPSRNWLYFRYPVPQSRGER